MPATPDSILALDFGERRIGVAIASLVAKLARPLTTLDNGKDHLAELKKIIDQNSVKALVVGLPRNLAGESTAQTEAAQVFGESLQSWGLPVHFQDEALTSQKAEAELKSRGTNYAKADIDALAATYILEDFLNSPAEIKL